MTRDPISPTSSTPDAGARRRAARPDPPTLIQGLEAIREGIRERLDRIEALALGRAASGGEATGGGESPERERTLQLKVTELEEKLGRLVAEARRREQEWRTALEQLEDDRKLLAEAWERLEQERVDSAPASAAATRSYAPHPTSPAMAARLPVNTETDAAVTHEVLKQFQALRGDVRKNGNGRRPRR